MNVRASAAGAATGSPHHTGDQGAVIGGPIVAVLTGATYNWYNIDWDSGADGWSAEKYGEDTPGFGNLSFTENGVASLAFAAGFRGVNLIKAIAMARAESNWSPNAIGTVTTQDTGLWQVNLDAHTQYNRQQMLDAGKNAAAAYTIAKNGTDWSPWVTYFTNKYFGNINYRGDGPFKQYLDSARLAASAIDPSVLSSAGNRVSITSNSLTVRAAAGGTDLARNRNSGSVGTLQGGPQRAQVGGTGEWFIWWQIAWDDGVTGWSAEEYLQRTSDNSTGLAGKAYAPSPASGTTGLSRTPHLSWSAGSSTSQFRIYVGTSPELGAGAPVMTQGVQYAFFEPEGLNFGTTYYYRVDSSNSAGTWTTGDVWSFTTESAPAVLAGKAFAPSPVSGTTGLSRTPRFTWSAGSNTTQFRIYLGTSSNFGAAAPVITQGVQYAFFEPEGLNFGTTYYFRVDSSNAAGTWTTGDVWSFATAPAVFSVTATAGAHGMVSPAGTQSVTAGGNITFSATPALMYAVNQWTMNGVPVQTGGNTFTLSAVSGDSAIAVSFKTASAFYTVTVSASPGAAGQVTGGGSYSDGQQASIQAIPSNGYYFDGWTDGASGLANPLLVTVRGHLAVRAKFTEVPSQLRLVQARFESTAPSKFALSLVGPATAGVVIQKSSDLLTWTEFRTVSLGTGGFVALEDSAPSPRRGYYRIKPAPAEDPETVLQLDFDDDQLPEGWSLYFHSFPRTNGGVANQRFEAREVDSTPVLTKDISSLTASGSLTFRWRANIINTYWGMGSAARIRMKDGSYFTAFGGKNGWGWLNGRIFVRQEPSGDFLFETNPVVPWGNYLMEAVFSRGTVLLRGVEEATGNIIFDETTQVAPLRMEDVAAVELFLSNTTGPPAWMDDVSISIVP